MLTKLPTNTPEIYYQKGTLSLVKLSGIAIFMQSIINQLYIYQLYTILHCLLKGKWKPLFSPRMKPKYSRFPRIRAGFGPKITPFRLENLEEKMRFYLRFFFAFSA